MLLHIRRLPLHQGPSSTPIRRKLEESSCPLFLNTRILLSSHVLPIGFAQLPLPVDPPGAAEGHSTFAALIPCLWVLCLAGGSIIISEEANGTSLLLCCMASVFTYVMVSSCVLEVTS